MTNLKGLTTGIGSLPHKDVESALDLVFKYTPQVPFWPQLPKRDIREGMVAQFMQRLPIPQSQDGNLFPPDAFAYPSGEKRLEEFYEKIINKDLNYFQITRDYAAGLYGFKERLQKQKNLLGKIEFIKCQITGPFTFAASIKDEEGKAYLHNPVYMQAFINGLVMKALWQIDFFKEFKKRIIMFVDEPYLGCFGSAYTPINREDVVRSLTELTQAIKSKDCLIGVHCCGNTDWSIFTDTASIDIINFDAYGFKERFLLYAENLKGFLKRGGIICWGIVPTQEFTGKESAQFLQDKIKDGIDILVKKGLDKDLLSKALMLSPSCGLGSLDIRKSEAIFRLLSELKSIMY